MSAKGKGKANNTVLIVSNNKDKRMLTPATTVIKLKKDILIKVRELAIFTGNKTRFAAYKTSIGLAV
jgi:hypothetical protein